MVEYEDEIVKKMGNKTLRDAGKAKNDEFYTQISDIANECSHYKRHFKGKTIFCNCDDPDTSNFWRYFHINFSHLELKKLISTHFVYEDFFHEGDTYKMEYTGGNDVDYNIGIKTTLKNNGDFRSDECMRILEEADIVITNPPFSLFREYMAQLIASEKKFLIIGNINAISYKEIFPLFRDNKIWMGPSIHSGDREFILPKHFRIDETKVTNHNYRIDNDGIRYLRVMGIRWFTNLDVSKRHEKMILYKKYTPEEYPHYDNYDAIEVCKVVEIPADWTGFMGVPISFLDKYNPVSFLDKYNPDQFKIIGMSASAGYNAEIVGLEKNSNFKDARPLINGKNTYARILIKRKSK